MSLNPSVWKVLCTCVNFPEDGETPDYNQLQQIHYNAQASNVSLSSLEKDGYGHLDGLRRQMRYGKHFECFMKAQGQFAKPKLRCLRGNLINL
jgi:hypothetical protein